jgi:hypothetical protein
MVGGVAAGARRPLQNPKWSGTPLSAMVGMSGKSA